VCYNITMQIGLIILILFFVLLLAAIAELFVIFKMRAEKKRQASLAQEPKKVDYEAYEISILNELSGKIDYSFNIQDVINVVTDSLSDLADYDAVSYILPLPAKIIFRGNLTKSVSFDFILDLKAKMISQLSGFIGKDISSLPMDEITRGSVLDSDSNIKLGAFVSFPLVVSNKVIGLLTIAKEDKTPYEPKQIASLQKVIEQGTDAITNLQNVIDMENSRLNAMVASMEDGVIMTDMDYKVLVANPKARLAAGLDNKKDLSLIDFNKSLAGKIDLQDKIEESLRMDRIFVSDEIQVPAGFFKIVISPVKNRFKPVGCVAVLRDISREKEVQQIKDDFTSMIVHELRSPLDSIKKMIESMRSIKMQAEQQEQYLQMIYASSSDMLGLVNNLLDMAKIEAGKFDLKKQPSSIKDIAKSRILFFDIAAKDQKINLLTQLSQDIPEQTSFDPHTISQVLNNLISNALKFNKENGNIIIQGLVYKSGDSLSKKAAAAGINWFIKTDEFKIQDSLFIAVTNTGQGIAPDQINKLFNKFFQVKSAFAEKGGTGLGLAITKSIIESHGGIVGAESTYGEGATFYFTIPLNSEL